MIIASLLLLEIHLDTGRQREMQMSSFPDPGHCVVDLDVLVVGKRAHHQSGNAHRGGVDWEGTTGGMFSISTK